MSLQERIFDTPSLYRMKIVLLSRVGKYAKRYFKKTWDVQDIVLRFNVRSIVDLGCGRGDLQTNLGLDVEKFYGIDPSFEMVKHASNLTKSFVVGRAENAPFRDNSFDLSVLSSVVHHIPIGKVVYAIEESLRVSSYTLILDNINSNKGFVRLIKNIWWKCLDGGTKYRTLTEWHELYEQSGAKVLYENYSKPFRHFYIAVIKNGNR
ncbi:hypothetical protein COT72_04000 [archaeon CG10_big_fil_rev_8_21_14_0_10_43_11]|nr:MAG: hypothetical protein COT72_04000 [archaeon CG10_big_fil_rev_8_21_14_0_10_43_11]